MSRKEKAVIVAMAANGLLIALKFFLALPIGEPGLKGFSVAFLF